MKKGSWLTQSLLLTTSLIILAGVTWSLFYYLRYTSKDETEFLIRFPKEQDLQLSFQGEYR